LVLSAFLISCLISGCSATTDSKVNDMPDNNRILLGNNTNPAISYSGHRKIPRSVENTPTIEETKEDLQILSALGIRLLRTYNTQIFPHSERTLQAIRELKKENPDFEMYVMLGAWIQCKDANTENPDHSREDAAFNQREIENAIRLAAEYPDIVRIIAVGNEAMVTWQKHFVPASTILRWVNVLGKARAEGRIPEKTWITTSDNWAALGGQESYRSEDLAELMRQMDFVSLHTYAFHDTYYNPELQWAPLPDEANLPVKEQIARSVERSIGHQKMQVQAVQEYLNGLGIDREIHIGETGWASLDNSFYGPDGTRAANEYTAGVFYKAAREWTREEDMTCFYFEAFDEPWKSGGTAGSEGHFGLLTVDGQAKYALWDRVDSGAFKGLSRGGNPIVKTHGGDKALLLEKLKEPLYKKHRP
jgi:exo-beta-1,3-glucanase (GH17 family)